MFPAQGTIREEVVTILDDMLVKCQNGAVEPRIVDRDVPAFTVSPGTGLRVAVGIRSQFVGLPATPSENPDNSFGSAERQARMRTTVGEQWPIDLAFVCQSKT